MPLCKSSMSRNILVTGSAGFIGFHLCKKLIEDGHKIIGIDNINDYYDTNLKRERLKKTHPFPNSNMRKDIYLNFYALYERS